MLDDIEGMMNDIERAELEAEQAGREDYVREHMSEVDVMNAADQDHAEYLHGVWLASLSPEERAEHDARLAAQQAELTAWKADQAANDDIPF